MRTRPARLTGVLAGMALLGAPALAAADPAPVAGQVLLLRTAPDRAADAARALPAGVSVLAVHEAVDVVVVRAGSAAGLARSAHVRAVTPDRTAVAADTGLAESTYAVADDPHSLLRTTSVVGARTAWSASGAGAGIDVAVIDTGVAPVAGLADTGRLAPGVDLSLDQVRDGAGTDTFGHGTHMAGIVAGRDPGRDPSVEPGSRSRFLGVAPNSRVVPVKVGDRYGATDVSQVIAGLDWVIRNARTDGRNVRVVNLSFGSDSLQGYELDPLAYAAERAWHAGLVVVVSAGNGGRDRLSDPAYDPYVIAVGASDTAGTRTTADDEVMAFSNRGDGTRGPDLVAPGRSQQSLRAPGSRIDVNHGATGRLGTRFFRGSGTSQAAAVVSGAAALVLADRPWLEPDQVKRLLRTTARPLPGVPASTQGAGLVDVAAAVAAPAPAAWRAEQRWTRSLGLGSVQAARGTPGTVLGIAYGSIGDYGVESFAQTNDPLAVAAAGLAAAGQLPSTLLTATWDGSTWDGSTWDGSTWDGSTWDGSTWDGHGWR